MQSNITVKYNFYQNQKLCKSSIHLQKFKRILVIDVIRKTKPGKEWSHWQFNTHQERFSRLFGIPELNPWVKESHVVFRKNTAKSRRIWLENIN